MTTEQSTTASPAGEPEEPEDGPKSEPEESEDGPEAGPEPGPDTGTAGKVTTGPADAAGHHERQDKQEKKDQQNDDGPEKDKPDEKKPDKEDGPEKDQQKDELDKKDPEQGKEPGDEPEQDPWAAFGPPPEVAPGRVRRAVRAVGRTLVHEWTLASVLGLALAVLMTWPTLRYPRHTIPQDIWDPTLQAWQMAWSGHILLTNPAQLWHSNAFYPESWSFAFSDTLLGYAPAGMIGEGPVAAVLRYNIMFVLAHALATVGAYALVRQLGAERIGAAVAAAGYAYAPWLLAQAGHLHIISNGGIPLALAMLARGHGWSLRHGYRPERRRPAWALAGWLVAAWQLSLGFGIGLVFAYVLALIALVAVVTWYARRIIQRVRRPFGMRLLQADFWGATIFAAVGLVLAIPYFEVAREHPEARRSVGQLDLYSPPLSGFFTAPAESRIWGGLHEPARAALSWSPEMTLLPGFVLYGLAMAGLFLSIWSVRQRLLLLAGVLVSGVLAMGTWFFGGTWTYLPLFEHLPGWDGLRTPGRLMLWTTLLLGVLAAGAVSAYAERAWEIASVHRVPARPGPLVRLVMLLPLALVLVEGLNSTPHPIVPPQPAALRDVQGPVLVLPSSQKIDENVMLWSTSSFPDLVNGGSGFTPRQLEEVRQVTVSFPDQSSIDYLRSMGVRTVVLLRDHIADTPWQSSVDLPVDQLGIQRQDVANAVVYRLS